MLEKDINKRRKLLYNIIKSYISLNGSTIKSLALKLSQEFDRKPSGSNLSNKIRHGTITFFELEELLDILDYDIEFKKRT